MVEGVTTTLREAMTAKGLPGECVVVPFDATWRGKPVRVTAVLKRTAVFEDERPFERHLDLQEMFEVGELQWREEDPSSSGYIRRAAGVRGRANAKGSPYRGRGRGWKRSAKTA